MAEDIVAMARLIVAETGPAGLSLTEIARRVGVTPPALYHHYGGLDEIIVAVAHRLVAEIVAAQKADMDECPPEALADRLLAATRAFRRWCIDNPQGFHLLFGTPPGISEEARTEMTGMWMRDLAEVWGELFQSLWERRPFPIRGEEELGPGLAAQLDAYRVQTAVTLPLGALAVFLSCWRSIYGAVSIEIMGHLPVITDHEPMFELMLADLFTTLGLAYRPPERG